MNSNLKCYRDMCNKVFSKQKLRSVSNDGSTTAEVKSNLKALQDFFIKKSHSAVDNNNSTSKQGDPPLKASCLEEKSEQWTVKDSANKVKIITAFQVSSHNLPLTFCDNLAACYQIQFPDSVLQGI